MRDEAVGGMRDRRADVCAGGGRGSEHHGTGKAVGSRVSSTAIGAGPGLAFLHDQCKQEGGRCVCVCVLGRGGGGEGGRGQVYELPTTYPGLAPLFPPPLPWRSTT